MRKKYFIIISLIMTCQLYSSENIPQGRVIILDGTSNAGKTSVAKPLLKLLGPSYAKVVLDDFVTELWLEKKGGYLPEQAFVERVHQRVDAMCDKVRSLVLDGKNVLLDTVISGLAGEDDSKRCFEKLQGLDVAMVLVYCPLPIVVERMKKGNEEALLQNEPDRMRPMVVSIKFADIYRVATENDIVVDMLAKKDIESVYKISRDLPEWERKLYVQLKEDLLKRFDLYDHDDVEVTSCLQYDCVVNTNTCTPEGCAQKIYDCFMLIKKSKEM